MKKDVIVPGGVDTLVNPLKVRFTHQHISSSFRTGETIDDVIEEALKHGEQILAAFPPMELVQLENGAVFSISNRRLFMFRVLSNHGVVENVPAVIYQQDAPRMQRKRFEPRLGRVASKWERSYNTWCGGLRVDVSSRFLSDHYSPLLDNSTPQALPATSVEFKTVPRRLTRDGVPNKHEVVIDDGTKEDCVSAPADNFWHASALRYGVLQNSGRLFMKTRKDGRMSLINEGTIRMGGRHTCRVSILRGNLAPRDGVGFVFSDQIKQDIQGIQSIFVNRRGLLCRRYSNGTIIREASGLPQMNVGMQFELDINLDIGTATVVMYGLEENTKQGRRHRASWNVADMPHAVGYFCVAFTHMGVEVSLT